MMLVVRFLRALSLRLSMKLWPARRQARGVVCPMGDLSGSELILVRKVCATCGGTGWLAVAEEGAGPSRRCEDCHATGFAEPEWVPFGQFLADFIELLNERSETDAGATASE
jgi:hypothetical protein